MTQISIKDLFLILNNFKKFLFKKLVLLIAISFFGGILGTGYAIINQPEYTSKVSFVVEESKMSSGGLASIAGQFGFDLGGSSSGVFSGDNVILFLTSESLCRETLLSLYDEKRTLADVYAEKYGLKKSWKKNLKLGETNFFTHRNGNMPRSADSLLQYILKKRVLKFNLSVIKPNSKAAFVEVKVKTRDEKLSYLFSTRLVEIATKNYVDSKIKIKSANISVMQSKADSLLSLLNEKTYNVASAQQSLVDANPAIREATVVTEISSREKAMITTLFAEVVKNLEIAKTILSQETPVVQIVDSSSFPLEVERISKLKGFLIGFFICFTVSLIFVVLRKWIVKNLEVE